MLLEARSDLNIHVETWTTLNLNCVHFFCIIFQLTKHIYTQANSWCGNSYFKILSSGLLIGHLTCGFGWGFDQISSCIEPLASEPTFT
jgi:hypothetical protein